MIRPTLGRVGIAAAALALPLGLAAVQGNIHSRRYLNHDGGPLSLACYDLQNPGVLGCPAWLQVRATAWSDITRPHFTHTVRTMFATVDAGDGAWPPY